MSIETSPKAKSYNHLKIILQITGYLFDLIILLVFIFSGASVTLREYLDGIFMQWWLVIISYVVLCGTIYTLINLPMRIYGGYIIEKRYGMSKLTISRWAFDWIKENLLSAALGIPLLLILYSIMRYTGSGWWLICSIVFIGIFVLMAQLAPVFLLPLFYKVVPLEDESLKERLNAWAKKHGSNVNGIYKLELSEKTNAVNAALTGLGNTRRILLGDTLLDSFEPEEIEAVLAHEFGHHAHNHLLKGIILQSIFFIVFFRILDWLLLSLGPGLGFISLDDIANLPFIILCSTILGLILLPFMNALMRHYERQADQYALEHTDSVDPFITTMTKLAKTNLADVTPHPIIEKIFYSHPSIAKRLAFAEKWRAEKYK